MQLDTFHFLDPFDLKLHLVADGPYGSCGGTADPVDFVLKLQTFHANDAKFCWNESQPSERNRDFAFLTEDVGISSSALGRCPLRIS
jgi:hypothetical protein